LRGLVVAVVVDILLEVEQPEDAEAGRIKAERLHRVELVAQRATTAPMA